MQAKPPADLLTSAITCFECKRTPLVSTVHQHGPIFVLVFECECGAISVMGLAPKTQISGVARELGTTAIPVLVLSDTTAKIALPPLGLTMSKMLKS